MNLSSSEDELVHGTVFQIPFSWVQSVSCQCQCGACPTSLPNNSTGFPAPSCPAFSSPIGVAIPLQSQSGAATSGSLSIFGSAPLSTKGGATPPPTGSPPIARLSAGYPCSLGKTLDPTGQKWRDLFASNHNSAEFPKLFHCLSAGNQHNCTFLDEDMDVNCDIWKLCIVSYVVGKFLRMKALHNIISIWRRDASLTMHDSGWLIYRFSNPG